MGDGFL